MGQGLGQKIVKGLFYMGYGALHGGDSDVEIVGDAQKLI